MSTPQAAALEAHHIAQLEHEFNYAVVKCVRNYDRPDAMPGYIAQCDRTRARYLQARGLTLAVR